MSLKLKKTLGTDCSFCSAAEARRRLRDRKGRGQTHPSAEQEAGDPPPVHAARAGRAEKKSKAAHSTEKDPPSPGGAASPYLQQPRDEKTGRTT